MKIQPYIIVGLLLCMFQCKEKSMDENDSNKIPSINITQRELVNVIKKDSVNKYIPKYHDEEIGNISRNIDPFIPPDYVLLDTVSGDLNLDNYNDLILVLKKTTEERTSDVIDNPEKRPLLILIGEPNNKYKLVERNDNTIYCVNCGGMMGDPYIQTVIKNGYFSVEHYGGSSLRLTRIITYKYSKEDKNWFLYKDGGESFNTSKPEKINKTIKTVNDFGKVLFKDFNIYK
ncbi:hypothetical protein [uncultured Cytophaga sp.]|uniref:hypothetical protein n=1 Tax=uncultured Cytophaga sp. TaxID=160238 RepID=UPI0026312A85|nr:hypothetical protein [uncultured Cytophaga sp.]